jgi:protein O-GlcNAc transferase
MSKHGPVTDAEVSRLIEEGNILEDRGDVAAALLKYLEAKQADPKSPKACLNCGNAQLMLSRIDEAIASYSEALVWDPRYASAYANLGRAYMLRNQYADAESHYAAAVRADPNFASGYIGLGCSLEALDRPTEAVQAYVQALKIQPENADISFSLGRLLLQSRRFDEAAKYLEASLQFAPNNADARAWLGKALVEMGLLQEGVKHMRLACELAPDDRNLRSMLLFTMNYLPDLPSELLFKEHVEFARRFCDGLAPNRESNNNVVDADRRLRIGYVSGDFREHPVARFIEAVIAAHDRDHYEIHCFHNFEGTDDFRTERLRQLADHWHRIAELDDEAVAQLVRQLQIDILVDLSGHTDRNRLLVFARKPAPLQATWLGYLGTTGLKTMDYRICDHFTDPPGMTERFHTERLARLPQTQWCHIPYDTVRRPDDLLPMLHHGYPTFGSFNNTPKINEQVVALWARALNAIPTARLCMAAVTSDHAKMVILNGFARLGVDTSRVEFLPRTHYHEYLSRIRAMDLMLDPFPYNGGTTTVDALAMGVPVITLAGDRSISRGGVSLLSTVGLADLIAANPDDYVAILQRLIEAPAMLNQIRQGLRTSVDRSVLQDSRTFTRQLEELYRGMWRDWCNN